MKKLITILIFFSLKSYSQDSVTLKVTWSKKVKDTVYYIFKMPTGEKVKSFCVCKEEKKRGEKVRVAVKDLEFIKQDL